MASIPMGNFGQSVAPAGPTINVQQGNPVGRAMERTGAIAGQMLDERASEIRKQEEASQRARAALDLAKAQNAMHDAHDEVTRGVMDGTIPLDKANSAFQSAASKVREATLGTYQGDQRTLMESHITGVEGSLQRNIAGAVYKRQQQDTAAVIDQFGEQVQREAARQGPDWASQKFGAMVDFTADAAGLSQPAREKLKQQFKERVHAQFYEQAGVGALTQGNPEALAELRAKLDGPAGEPLDPTKRVQLQHQFFGWEQSILAKRERAANAAEEEARKRHNEAVDVYNKATDVALGGGFFSPEFITELTTKGAGTEMQAPIGRLIASQRVVAGFASLPATERQAAIERMRAERATPGQGTDPLNEKLLSAMVTMDDKLRAQAKDNPWAAAQQAGVIQDAQVYNPGDPQGAVQVLQSRMKTIGRIEAWVGNKVSPLQPDEVASVAKFVRQLPLDQTATMLAGMGAALGDAERGGALAKQLHDKDGAVGLAMMYANAKTTEGRTTAELVLRGEQALKDNTAMVDRAASSGWKGTIAKSIRGAYQNREIEDASIDAAFKIAAGMYAKDGSADIDRAIRLATGGITERNGAKVPIPYGMSERDFNKRVEGFTVQDLETQADGGRVFAGNAVIPLADFVAQIPKATLQHAGPGLYAVRSGAGLVTGRGGAPVLLKVAP